MTVVPGVPPSPKPAPKASPKVPGRKVPWPLVAGLALPLLGVGLWLAVPRKPPPPWKVDILSSPPGAHVTIRGELAGKTPLLGKEFQKEERPIVEVTLLGYVPQTRMLTPTDTQLEFKMARSSAVLDVHSDPEDAEVTLDGQVMGRTPLKGMPLPTSGLPKLVIRKEGYEEWSTSLDKDSIFPEMITLTPLRRRRR